MVERQSVDLFGDETVKRKRRSEERAEPSKTRRGEAVNHTVEFESGVKLGGMMHLGLCRFRSSMRNSGADADP